MKGLKVRDRLRTLQSCRSDHIEHEDAQGIDRICKQHRPADVVCRHSGSHDLRKCEHDLDLDQRQVLAEPDKEQSDHDEHDHDGHR
jgi:hypothetical protein